MPLDSVARRLDELAETDSPLQRSRAMAQLWSDIRLASPEDRRRFAHALADRFAPAIADRFESVAGIEGPEFIKLVRDLIDLDSDDIRAVISDLGEAAAASRPEAGDDGGDTTGPEGAEGVRDEAIDRLFDRISEEVGDAIGRPGAEDVDALLDDSVETSALAQAVEALEDLPESEQRPSAFDAARERLSRLESEDDTGGDGTGSAPEAPTGEAVETTHPPAVVREPPGRVEPPIEPPSQLQARLANNPDGWRRRRLLSAAIRGGEVDTATALELSEMLSSSVDRGWIAGDLIERGVAESERELFRDRGLPPHIIRRMDRSS